MGQRSGEIAAVLQALFALFLPVFISACEVEFEPQIEPLILATLPAKPFSGSPSIDAEMTPVSPPVSPIEPVLEEINIAGVVANLPKLLILVSGASGFS
jgi:hypothetical protein